MNLPFDKPPPFSNGPFRFFDFEIELKFTLDSILFQELFSIWDPAIDRGHRLFDAVVLIIGNKRIRLNCFRHLCVHFGVLQPLLLRASVR